MLVTIFGVAFAFVPNLIPMGYYSDKALHVFVFCVFTLFLTFRSQRSSMFLFYISILLFAGCFIEVIQSFIPARNAEWFDLLANCGGVCLGLVIGGLVRSGLKDLNHA